MSVRSGDSAVFHRDPSAEYPVLVRGRGFHVWDDEGTRFVDLGSGFASPVGIGHGRSEVASVLAAQAERLAFVNNARATTDRQEELGSRIVALAPPGLDKVMFSSGASEANEIAIRLARQYHLARGAGERWKVVSLRPGYHGATAGAMAVSGREGLSDDYAPYLIGHPFIQAPIRFRGRYRGLTDAELVAAARDDLVETIERAGPSTVSALIGEVVSSTAGMAVPPPGFWPMVRSVCDYYDVLVIMDEAVTGMGRSGHLVASTAFGINPDLLVLSKGLTAGYMPMAATAIAHRITEVIAQAGRGMAAVHSYAGNPLACAVALEVIDIIERDGVLDMVARAANDLERVFNERLNDIRLIGDIRGVGLMRCVEFVSPATTSVIPEEHAVARRVARGMYDRGFLLSASRYDGVLVGDCANFFPVFATDVTTLEAAAEALREVALEIEADSFA